MHINSLPQLHLKLMAITQARLKQRLWLLMLLLLALASPSLAQGTNDYHKVEVYGGYSLARSVSNNKALAATSPGGTETFNNLCSSSSTAMLGVNGQRFVCDRRSFHGFDTSFTYNVSKYFGLKGNLTGHFKTDQFVDVFNTPAGPATQTIDTRERLYNFLVGVQVKNNGREARFKPFAHLLLGGARYTDRQSQTISIFPQFNYTADDRETSFALKFGGGLDVRLSRSLDLRLIEFDYNPIFAGDRRPQTISGPFTFAITGKTAHNYTFSFGLVIH